MHTFTDPQEFLNAARAWLETEEAKNSLMLGNTLRMVAQPGYFEETPYYAVVGEPGEVALAAMMTPPFGLVLATARRQPEDKELRELIDDLRGRGLTPPDVIGPNPHGLRFAELWHGQTGLQPEIRQRLYELRAVTPDTLTAAQGSFRMAREDEIELLTGWAMAFDVEAFGRATRPPESFRSLIEKRWGDIAVWEDGRAAVSMAMRSRPTRHGITVNLVYTPPDGRGRGYATACVARLSQSLLDEGFQFCTLFTDMDNPTSNSIYMKIGYTPVCDFDKYTLG
ncbi:MAG: GNAT family N-acetyltransferase [Anaerolineae bacterium]|nr:MAG: GNAT family N-acetyltransferase [Anaerolineae bacterium]